jgi:hypothetical protein
MIQVIAVVVQLRLTQSSHLHAGSEIAEYEIERYQGRIQMKTHISAIRERSALTQAPERSLT